MAAPQWRVVVLVVVTAIDIGAALLYGVLSVITSILTHADLTSADDYDEPRAGGVFAAIFSAVFAVLGVVFSVAVWSLRSTFRWIVWNLLYFIVVEGVTILFFSFLELDHLSSAWFAVPFLPGAGILSCVAALVLQKKYERKAVTESLATSSYMSIAVPVNLVN